MTTQRKIPHLLASEGDGASFRYLRKLGVPLDFSRPMLVTEKVDGSTMQARDALPHKRYDRFSKGDPRKHGASEEERYELRACARSNPAEKWYLDAFEAHLDGFREAARLRPDVWIYFEALGAKIGARYPDLPPTIRVFDIADATGFLPFEQTIELAVATQLPRVAFSALYLSCVFTLHSERAALDCLFESLTKTSSDLVHPTTKQPYVCEGWVIRQDETVAKIRVADLKRLA